MKLKISFILICAFLYSIGTAQIDVPSLSPEGRLTQKVGYTIITVDYDRPSMRGAVIFGSTIPYGKLWDMSVNGSTIISFTDPVTIEGQEIDAGVYAINAIPDKHEWTIIFDKASYYTHSMSINPHNKEVLRVKAIPEFLDCHIETFTIDVGEITQSSASLIFSWENTKVKVRIGTKADKIAMDKIDRALKNPMFNMGNTYLAAAAYYLDNHKDIDQAMVWVDKAIELNGKEDSNLFLKAKIYAEMGDYEKAIDNAEEAYAVAETNAHTAFMNLIYFSLEKWKELKHH
jgi:hypothetical protein